MAQKILAIIPARGGSKGVPRKNVRPLGGKPMIGWTIDAAKQSKRITDIIVTTDDQEINDVSCAFGARVIDRPAALAQDNSTTADAIHHALSVLAAEGYVPDLLILLQCTTPFRTTESIDGAIDSYLAQAAQYESLLSVAHEEYPPYWLKNIAGSGELTDFLPYNKAQYARRQDFPPVYKLNGAIYITPTERFTANNGFASAKQLAYVMNARESVDIDTEEDFRYAEYLAAEGTPM